MSSERLTEGRIRLPLLAVAAVAFVVYFALISLLVVRAPVLYDGDSYYHLAVARLYAKEGLFAKVPWPRLSLLAGGGDKELLFHLALLPASLAGAAGGRIALAAINAAIAMLIGIFAYRRSGASGLMIPLWLWIAAPPFLGRAVRLRPELFALLIILLAVTVRPRRRGLWLGVLALLFTWSYTAFHVFLALCFLWFVASTFSQGAQRAQRPQRARWLDAEWSSIWMPAAGTLLGLIIRPYPLANVHLWYVQNVEFFLSKSRLDVGNEITRPDAWYFTSALPWLAGAVALLMIGRGVRHSSHAAIGSPAADRLPDVQPGAAAGERPALLFDPVFIDALIATLVFAILFAFMSRMAVYLFPLATIACVATAPRTEKTWARVAALAIAIAIALPIASRSNAVTLLRMQAAPEEEWRRFGQSVPAGARIVADWSPAEVYAFWAPQGRYLNVLDPVFMALPYPRQHAALRRLLAGHDPDLASTITDTLQSDYLAFSRPDTAPLLAARVEHDPRMEIVRNGVNVLARVDLRGAARFVTEWNARAAGPFISVSRGSCKTFRHSEPPHAAPIRLEFAPYSESVMRIDDRPLVSTKATPGAILGQGFVFDLTPSATPQQIEVTTCRARDGIGGFYLVRR